MSKEDMEEEARQLALYIFWNLKNEFDSMHITRADLQPLLTPLQVDRCMAFLDLDGDQRVSLQELRDAVVKVYQVSNSAAWEGSRTYVLQNIGSYHDSCWRPTRPAGSPEAGHAAAGP